MSSGSNTEITDLVSSAKLIKLLVSKEVHENGVATAKNKATNPHFRKLIEPVIRDLSYLESEARFAASLASITCFAIA